MKLSTKKEIIYVALAFFGATAQLTWVQMAYNDPSFVQSWSPEDLKTIIGISAVFVVYQTLITWKAYLSDPSRVDQTIPTPPEPTPKEPAE